MPPNSRSQSCQECGAPIASPSEQVKGVPLTVCSACANAATIAPFDPTATIMPVSAGHPPKYQQDSRARFDRYEERQKIGTWEHGDIYSARHQGLDCRVTMRVLELTDETSPELKTQFIERVKAISGLNHPNTVQTMEAGIDEGVAFIVQPQFEAKPIEGFQPRGLLERSTEGFFPNSALNTTMRSVVTALKAIHDQGIVHGNINSKSIVVCPSGVVRLTGLIEPQITSAIDPPAEVCPQHSIRADILQLGCAFFHITTQSHPESHLCNQTAKQISAKLKKKNPGLQKSIRDVIARCLTFGGSSYQNCSEILAELARASEQITLRVPWRLRIYSLACEFVALAMMVPVAVFFFSSSKENFMTQRLIATSQSKFWQMIWPMTREFSADLKVKLLDLEIAANPWVSPLYQFLVLANLMAAAISIYTVFRTPKRQALHDLATGTIVIRD